MRWEYLASLDEKYLKGGVVLSEWCSEMVKECDLAFVHGAHLASILTAVAAVETYLRSEYGQKKRSRLVELIDQSPLDADLKDDLHELRRYRNSWVHVDEPWDDSELLSIPERYEYEADQMSHLAVDSLRRTIYENPCS